MEMQKVEGSTLIAATGHDPDTNKMAIEFNDGAVHEYANVPAAVHEHLRAGGDVGSVGKTFHSTIKGVFESVRVPTPEEEVRTSAQEG